MKHHNNFYILNNHNLFELSEILIEIFKNKRNNWSSKFKKLVESKKINTNLSQFLYDEDLQFTYYFFIILMCFAGEEEKVNKQRTNLLALFQIIVDIYDEIPLNGPIKHHLIVCLKCIYFNKIERFCNKLVILKKMATGDIIFHPLEEDDRKFLKGQLLKYIEDDIVLKAYKGINNCFTEEFKKYNPDHCFTKVCGDSEVKEHLAVILNLIFDSPKIYACSHLSQYTSINEATVNSKDFKDENENYIEEQIDKDDEENNSDKKEIDKEAIEQANEEQIDKEDGGDYVENWEESDNDEEKKSYIEDEFEKLVFDEDIEKENEKEDNYEINEDKKQEDDGYMIEAYNIVYGLTLYNYDICVQMSLYAAFKEYLNKNTHPYFEQGFYFLILTLLHEMSHVKRILFSSDGDYFQDSPKNIDSEAGNYLERQIINAEVIKPHLSSVSKYQHYMKEQHQQKDEPNSMIKTKILSKSELNPFLDGHLTFCTSIFKKTI
jgi:hypothetical protein